MYEIADGYRLVRLSVDQVGALWEGLLKEPVLASLPDAEKAAVGDGLFVDFLEGHYQAWLLMRPVPGGKEPEIAAVLSTTVGFDAGTDKEFMVVYSLYAMKNLSLAFWQRCMEVLLAAVKDMGYGSLRAQTENRQVMEFWQRIGKPRVRFIGEWEV